MKDALDVVAGFDWDEGNIDKNRTAHAVENWECEQIFFNQTLLVLDVPKHSLTEKRWAAVRPNGFRAASRDRIYDKKKSRTYYFCKRYEP